MDKANVALTRAEIAAASPKRAPRAPSPEEPAAKKGRASPEPEPQLEQEALDDAAWLHADLHRRPQYRTEALQVQL